MSAVLTDDEVTQLTGYKQPSKQIVSLRKMGLNPNIRPDGTPGVMRDAVVQVQVTKRAPREPNIEAAR